MATESGWSNSKKWGEVQHKTIHNLGSSRYGQHVVSKSLAEKAAIPVAIESVALNSDQNKILIGITAHGAKVGDVLRFYSGSLLLSELDIISIPNANSLIVFNSVGVPAVADTVKVMSYVTAKSDAEGNMNFSPGPTTFIKDAATVTVTKDTAVPGNTIALPVEIVAASGTEINITAGDINIQTTHTGANPDSMRIGDGTTELGITLANEAKVHDADAKLALDSIDLKTPALVAGKVPVDTGLTPGLTDAELRATPVAVDTGLVQSLTDTQLRATPVVVDTGLTPLTDTQLRATPVVVDTGLVQALTDTQLRATPVGVSSSQLPAALGQQLQADSISVALCDTDNLYLGNISLDTSALVANIGSDADVAEPDHTQYATVTASLKGIVSRITDSNALLTDIKTAVEVVAELFDDETDAVSDGVVKTFTKPVGATRMVISNNAGSMANRIRWSFSTPSWATPVGAILGVGSFTSEIPAGTFKCIAEDNTSTADVTVLWF